MWKCENVANNQYQLPIGTGNWSWQHFHIGNIAAKPLLALAVCILACFNAALAQDVFRAETQRRGDFTPYSLRLSDSARGYWIDENISTAGDTGEWSRDVLYERATGRATLDGEYVFTPNAPSGEPIGNAAALANASQTCLEFRRGQSNSPQTCLEFRRTKSNSPQACPEFRRTKSNCPQGPPEFGWTQSNSPQAPSESGWAQSKETSLKNTI